jgi:DTW domain-containing protein YfiP
MPKATICFARIVRAPYNESNSMNLSANNQAELVGANPVAPLRDTCLTCRRALVNCYCAKVRPFESNPAFVILIEPKEARHRFGTGRMAHHCLSNSLVIEGVDFTEHGRVNAILGDPNGYPMLLYPGSRSINLSNLAAEERAALIPADKKIVVFLLDGTWKTVRKMIRASHNLRRLPFISFEPPTPSNYRIRLQPRPYCYSSIEAIHQVIDLLAVANKGETTNARPHDNLLEVFDFSVGSQLQYLPWATARLALRVSPAAANPLRL